MVHLGNVIYEARIWPPTELFTYLNPYCNDWNPNFLVRVLDWQNSQEEMFNLLWLWNAVSDMFTHIAKPRPSRPITAVGLSSCTMHIYHQNWFLFCQNKDNKRFKLVGSSIYSQKTKTYPGSVLATGSQSLVYFPLNILKIKQAWNPEVGKLVQRCY